MTSRRFQKQRRAFQRLRHTLHTDAELRAEVELALHKVLRSYPTKIRENRFVVGGVVEVILVAAFRAAGLPAADVGPREARVDIELQGGGGFSVKGHFGGSGDIRMINVLGESVGAAWEDPTLFVMSGLGIGYADPDLVSLEYDAMVKRHRDAVAVRASRIKRWFRANADWVIECVVPERSPPSKDSRLASREIAHAILESTPRLKQALEDAT